MKSALFLHVWLRRQEIEIAKTRLLSQALSDVASSNGGQNIGKEYSSYLSAVFPFINDVKGKEEQAMIDRLKKESKFEYVKFQPVSTKLFTNKMKELSLPDDFKQKLLEVNKRKK